jgi:hypothetical protein
VTLVSILGDFHSSILPLSYAFKKEITRHVIVYDDARADIAKLKRIEKGQKAFFKTLAHNSSYHYEFSAMQIDEDSYDAIHRCYERIIKLEENPSNIYLNTTDGLSSIAILLSSKLLADGGNVLSYDRYDNSYNLHKTHSMTHHLIKNNMDIKSHLLMKGYDIVKTSNPKALAKRKSVVLKLTENLPAYKKFANEHQYKSSSQIFGNDGYKRLLDSIGMKDNKFYIQGSVFEEYIYHLIVDNFDFDDVWLGTTVLFSEAVENEFDILMIKDNHLHTIECKFKQNLNGKPMVYMMTLLMDYLDDDGKAMILNIGGENKNTNSKHFDSLKFDNADKHRARYGDIKIHVAKEFDEKKFLKDVGNWFIQKEDKR